MTVNGENSHHKIMNQLGNSLLASLESKGISNETEHKPVTGPPLQKKNTIGVSALLAFNNNQGYTFEPLKKYKVENVFFGLDSKKELPPVEPEKPPTPIPEVPVKK